MNEQNQQLWFDIFSLLVRNGGGDTWDEYIKQTDKVFKAATSAKS